MTQKAKISTVERVTVNRTLGGLIAAYLNGREFRSLAERTQADYRELLEAEWIKKDHVQAIRGITTDVAEDLVERALARQKWSRANYLLRVLRIVFNWGMTHRSSIVTSNPFEEVEPITKPKDAPISNRPWEPWEFQAVIEAASPQLKIALMLGRYAGIPEGVVLELTWSAYDGTRIEYCTTNGTPVRVPVCPVLKEFLDGMKQEGQQIVLNRRKSPFTGDGFRGSLFKLLRRLQKEKKVKPGLTFHRFTRTRVRDMANAGATKLEIMAAVGHTTPKMVDLYLQEIARERQAGRAMERLK